MRLIRLQQKQQPTLPKRQKERARFIKNPAQTFLETDRQLHVDVSQHECGSHHTLNKALHCLYPFHFFFFLFYLS